MAQKKRSAVLFGSTTGCEGDVWGGFVLEPFARANFSLPRAGLRGRLAELGWAGLGTAQLGVGNSQLVYLIFRGIFPFFSPVLLHSKSGRATTSFPPTKPCFFFPFPVAVQ